MEFEIVDVFAEGPRRGNQLAVVFPDRALAVSEMQSIAREFDFSETTFVGAARDDGHEVRIFLPDAELPFAGHPTLGTAHVLRAHSGGPRSVLLHLGVGPVAVRFEAGEAGAPDVGWIQSPTPEIGAVCAREQAAAVFGLEPRDLDPELPPRVVTSGISFLLVPLRDLAALRRARLHPEARRALDRTGAPPLGTFCFTREAYSPSRQIAARALFDIHGNVREDPATGSANGALAGYLLAHRVFGTGALDVRVEQGVECHRPSLLHLRGRIESGRPRVEVGGSVFPFARGALR